MQTRQVLIVYSLFLLVNCSTKLNRSNETTLNRDDGFELIAITKNDTLSLADSSVLIGQVRNNNDKPFFFSSDFEISSNLFPNADFSSQMRKSVGFLIELAPVPNNTGIVIENDIMSFPNSFVKLNPKSVLNYKIDVAKHINIYNEEVKTDSFKIVPNRWYTLNLTFGHFGNWSKVDTFTGSIKAIPIKFYLKE